jgi:hypothetical protein
MALQRAGELFSGFSSFKVHRRCIFGSAMKLAAKLFFLPGDLVALFVRPRTWRRRLALPGPCA